MLIRARSQLDLFDLNDHLFFSSGGKVKVNLRFQGREMAHQELGFKLLKKVMEVLGDVALTEAPPKMEGRQMFILLAPDAMKVKDYLKLHPKPAPLTVHEKKQLEEENETPEAETDSEA